MNQVVFTKSASKEFKALPPDIQRQLSNKIKGLAENALPDGVKKLKGTSGYRLRSGDYRILYDITGTTVKIFAVGNRKDIYR